MRILAALAATTLLVAPAALADNWGSETSGAIQNGWDQGGHASQQQNPRSGLGNVNKLAEESCGNGPGLFYLLEFLSGQC